MFTCVFLCKRDHVFRCSHYVPTLWVGHAKSASVSTLSSQSQARADRFTSAAPKRLCCMSSRCAQIRKKLFHTSSNRLKLSSRRAVSVHARHPANRACTSCSTPAACVSKKIGAFLALSPSKSALVRFVRFFLVRFFVFFDCTWGRSFGAQDLARKNKVAQKSMRTSKKNFCFHSIRAQNRHPRQISSEVRCNLNTALPMECHKMSTSHRSSCRGVCLERVCHPKSRQHLLVGQVVFLDLLCHSFGPCHASDSEFHCTWHNAKLSMQHFDRSLLLVRLSVPSFSSSLQGAVLQVYSGLFPAVRAHSLSSFRLVLQNRTSPTAVGPCLVALATLHLNLKSTCGFPACATRSRLPRFVFPSLAKDMCQFKKLTALQESVQTVWAQGEVRLTAVRKSCPKSTEFVHRFVDMGEGQGTTLTYVCPHCLRLLTEDHIWWITQHGDLGKKQEEAVWMVVCGGGRPTACSSSNTVPRIDVLSKLLECHVSFPHCITANTCWWDRSSSWICSATLLARPKRRILSSIAIGPIPSFRCSTSALRPSFLVTATSRLASLFWPLSRGEELILW